MIISERNVTRHISKRGAGRCDNQGCVNTCEASCSSPSGLNGASGALGEIGPIGRPGCEGKS